MIGGFCSFLTMPGQLLLCFSSLCLSLSRCTSRGPYWSWHAKTDQVREYLRSKAESYKFEWPLLRDSFNYCHCLISRNAFVITPILPLVDLIPTFDKCQRRIFMSATIGDDSDIVRSFDADRGSIAKPISSTSLDRKSTRLNSSHRL